MELDFTSLILEILSDSTIPSVLGLMQFHTEVILLQNEDENRHSIPIPFKPKLHLNQNCHSSSIKGQAQFFELDNFDVVEHSGFDEQFPIIYLQEDIDATIYSGIVLQRIILSLAGMSSLAFHLSDDTLEKIMIADHYFCTHTENIATNLFNVAAQAA